MCCWRLYTWSLLLFSHQVVSDSSWPHGLQHARLPCPSPSSGECPSPCLLNRWCHPTISSSVTLSFCLQSCPASGSFSMSQLFTSGGQNIGASALASVLPKSIQGWFPLGFTGLISLLSKGPSRVFSSNTIQKQFFSPLPSLFPTLTSIHDYQYSYTWCMSWIPNKVTSHFLFPDFSLFCFTLSVLLPERKLYCLKQKGKTLCLIMSVFLTAILSLLLQD